MLPSTKLRLYNITSKAALKYGSEVCVLSKKRMPTIRNSTNELNIVFTVHLVYIKNKTNKMHNHY
jgi:hypothetical protein